MLRGFLAFCILLPVHCSRQSSYSYAQILAESSSVPKVIYDALREAGALVQTHLETLQEAERLAEQRQADSSARIDEKTQAMKAMQTQMDFVATKAKATRDLMLQVDTAAAKHSKAGEDHQKSITEFGKASDALEEMAKKVTLKEQKLRDIFGDYKRELGDLKSQWDKMSQERDQAEAEMKDLKTQAMSAGKFKTSVQEEQAKVERDMQLAQQELQGMRRELETAVSAATVAEAQEAQAVNEAREADGRVEVAKKTRAYLMKIRRAVQAYYGSIDELESAVDGKANVELKEVPEAKMVLEKYNLMLSAFGDLHAYDAEVYEKVTAAKEEVKNNAFAQLRFICDMLGISTSEEGHCLTGLWKTFGMAKLQFPDEEVEKAPEAPEEIEDVIPDEPLEELEEEEDDDMDIETPQEPEAKHDAMDIETPQELEAKHDDMDIETPQEPEEEDDDMDIDTPQEPEARHDAMDIETPQELEAKHDAMDIETPQEPEEEDDDMDMETPQEPEEEDDDMDIESEPANDATQRLGKRRSDVPPASPAKNRKRKRVADETLPDLPLPAPKRFKRSAPEPEEPPSVQEVPKASPKNRKRKRVADEMLPDLPLPAPKRFKRSAPEPEEPPSVQEVPKVSLKNRKRKRSELEYDPLAHQRVTDEPLPDLPLPAPKRFKRSAPEPEEPPFVQEVPKASPAKNRKRKRVTDEPLPDLPLPAPKRFKRSAPEPEEPPFVQEVPKASPATNLKRKRSPENDPLAFQRVTDEPLPDLPLPAPKRFKRSAPEPEEPPFVQEVPKASPATNLKRKRLPENDPLAFQRVTDEPLPDLPLPAPKRFKRSAPEPEEPPFVQEVPKAPMSTAAPVAPVAPVTAAIECGGAQVHWASCSKRDGCRYVKKADVSRCGVSQHGCYDESQLPSECQLSLAPAPPSGCGGGGVHFASCYKKSGCRYVKKEDVTLCGVSLYGCYAVKELPLACQPQVRGVRVRLS